MGRLIQKCKQTLSAKIMVFRCNHPKAFRLIAYYGLLILASIAASIYAAVANIS